ncbi:hypothetical protein HPP_2740 [Hydrangea phyllody phytoplasma]|uniref:Uncharacterized protein n=2 Tax=16SrI (Aster yellows group) TaxID=3042590 RepID=A0ABQ5PSD5_9MOLU|nr:hypothetical protein HPP_2740 [Hydrangea phyllody phytoplasma]GLH61129.1 hypothetical protein RHYP_0740 [Rhus yellows phytoplasma]GLH62112.1 hypothetical protein HP2P_5190 [Hydrangea phyllody phytoplasma]
MFFLVKIKVYSKIKTKGTYKENWYDKIPLSNKKWFWISVFIVSQLVEIYLDSQNSKIIF